MSHWWMWHCLSVHPSQVSVVCCYAGLAVFEHGDEPPMDVALSVRPFPTRRCHCCCTGVSVFEDEDEPLVDAALAADVFSFIKHCIVANAEFHQEVCISWLNL